MEDELMSLQRKIMALESKLNYPGANGGTGDQKPAEPKEQDSLSKYKEHLLGNLQNVVFSDPPMGMFSIDGQDSELRTKRDEIVKIKVDIRGKPMEEDKFMASQMETGRSLQSKLASSKNISSNKRPTSASTRGYITQSKLGKSTSQRSFGISSPSQRGKLTGLRQPRSSSREPGALSKRTSASAAKTKELNKPHNFLRRSNSSLTRAFNMSSKKTKIDPAPKKFEQKIISKSSIP